MKNLPALTSLRFFAAALVVIHHTQTFFPWARWVVGTSFGQGVSFFFVLSGFILTHVYSQRKTRFPKFMMMRFARLWPVHFATLIMVALFIRTDSQQFPGEGFFDPKVAFIFNLTLLHSLMPFQSFVFSWNSPSWSISTEFFFYIMFPLLLLKIDQTWPWKLMLFAIFIGLYGLTMYVFDLPSVPGIHDLNRSFLVYASPLFRGFEFVLGMAAYVLWRRLEAASLADRASTVLEIVALAVIIWWVAYGLQASRSLLGGYPGLAEWQSSSSSCFVSALLIVAVASGKGLLSRALALRPLVYLGEVSFSLYMVHQIVMKWLFLKAYEGVINPAGPMMVFVLCLACAILLYHLVERPSREWIISVLSTRGSSLQPRT